MFDGLFDFDADGKSSPEEDAVGYAIFDRILSDNDAEKENDTDVSDDVDDDDDYEYAQLPDSYDDEFIVENE